MKNSMEGIFQRIPIVRIRAKNEYGNTAWVHVIDVPIAFDSLWSATLTPKALGGIVGCDNDSAGNECSATATLSDDGFTRNGLEWQVSRISRSSSGLALSLNRARSDLSDYYFCIGDKTFPLRTNSAGRINGETGARANHPFWDYGDQRQNLPSLTPGTPVSAGIRTDCPGTPQATRSTNANLSGLAAGAATSSEGTYSALDIGAFMVSTTDYAATVATVADDAAASGADPAVA